MVSIETRYEGDLRCVAVHGPSGNELATDAPVDNQGRGETFSPTDLIATALSSCTLTIMAMAARRAEIGFEGVTATAVKHMATDPRRIGEIPIEIRIPGRLTDKQKRILESAARSCPVAKSLRADLAQGISFVYVGD